MTREEKKKNKEIPVCLDLCEHCVYIENGDFICDETNQLVISDWTPGICLCPENKKHLNYRKKS